MVLILGYLAWSGGAVGPVTRSVSDVTLLPAIGWFCLIGATLCIVAFHRNRLLVLVLIGVVGVIVSLGFNYFSAPDLALTQISVEVVTIILLLLALNFMPRMTPRESSAGRRTRDAVLSIGAGLGVGMLIYAILLRDFAFPTISDYHLANSYKGGGGTNVGPRDPGGLPGLRYLRRDHSPGHRGHRHLRHHRGGDELGRPCQASEPEAAGAGGGETRIR